MALDHATPLPGPADTVGGRIRQARRYVDLNQTELGVRIGASRESVINWEKGRFSPSVDHLIHIADVTGFPATWFIEGLDGDEWAPWGSNPRPMDYVFGQLELPVFSSGAAA